MTAGEPVWVIDASALIDTKREIAAQHQWAFFERLKMMVRSGSVCFPKAVRNELQQARYVDMPEAWALDVCTLVQHSYEPAVDAVAHVMETAGDVVDTEAEGDPGDPYVLAQALEIQAAGMAVCVVTNDRIDRLPIKIALTTACDLLDLPHCALSAFLAAVGFHPNTGWS